MCYEGLCLKTMTAAPADPLADLPPPELRRLETQARADLLRKVPYLRALLAQGKCRAAIRHRMCYLLAGPSTLPAPRPGTSRDPWDYPDPQP